MIRPDIRQQRLIVKPLWFAACLAPFIWFCLRALEIAGEGLGADPIEATQDYMGIWALRLLLVTLAITPLRRLTGMLWLIRLRRMTGLFALFYASAHFLNYLLPDQGLLWSAIVEDVLERPFITVGALGLAGLIALGVTSTRGWQIRLGKRWQKLHRLVYPIAILAVWHFWWQVKAVVTEPAIYALILAILLVSRLPKKNRARHAPDAEQQ